MPQSSADKSKYWLPFFLAMPLISAMQFGDAYEADKGMKVLYSGLAGGVGGLLGFAAYYFTANRPVAIRLVTLVSVVVLTALPTILLPAAPKETKSSAGNHSTCPVCGYIAFKAGEQSCGNCGEELTEEELRKSGLSNMDSLIRLDQAFYFIPEEENAPISFEQPAVSEDGYTLDKSWQPSVSEAAVKTHATEYFRFQKRSPVKVRVIEKQ